MKETKERGEVWRTRQQNLHLERGDSPQWKLSSGRINEEKSVPASGKLLGSVRVWRANERNEAIKKKISRFQVIASFSQLLFLATGNFSLSDSGGSISLTSLTPSVNLNNQDFYPAILERNKFAGFKILRRRTKTMTCALKFFNIFLTQKSNRIKLMKVHLTRGTKTFA